MLAALLLAPCVAPAADCTASATSRRLWRLRRGHCHAGRFDRLADGLVHVHGGGTRDVPYVVTLGSANSPSPATRWLATGSFRLYYNLYRNAARTEIWGDGTAGSFVVSGTLRPGPGVGNNTRIGYLHRLWARASPAGRRGWELCDTIFVTLTF